MQDFLSNIDPNEWLRAGGGLLILAVLAWLANVVTRRVFLALVHRVASRTRSTWDDRIIERRVFHQLANVAPEAFEDPDHRRAFELMVEGVAPDRWPDELGRLLIRLRVEVADSPPGPGELREAGYRLQVPLLEQRAARLREEGDSAELFHALDLLRRVRDALRGEG